MGSKISKFQHKNLHDIANSVVIALIQRKYKALYITVIKLAWVTIIV